MIRSLWIAKTGMEAQQTQLDTISHNLANVATNGFKRSHAIFEDLIYQNLRQSGANTTEQTQLPTGLQVGLGVRPVATSRIYSQGNLQQTTNNLDLAIKGNGFFQIQQPDGTTAYTRDGSLPARRQRPDRHQQRLHPAARHHHPGQCAEPDHRPTTARSASPWPGNAAPQTVGQMQLANFINPAGLDPKGQNLFTETASSGTPNAGAPNANGLGALQQGFVETSNVNVVEELVVDDPDPARLRAEFQGRADLGPDAAETVADLIEIAHEPDRCSSCAWCRFARRLQHAVHRAACRAGAHAGRAVAARPQRRPRTTGQSFSRPATGRCSRTTAPAWSATR